MSSRPSADGLATPSFSTSESTPKSWRHTCKLIRSCTRNLSAFPCRPSVSCSPLPHCAGKPTRLSPEFLPHLRAERYPQMALCHLSVGCSPIDSPFPVARFLSLVFPGLQVVNASSELDGPETEEGRAKWAEVVKLLPMFSAIRLEEQMYGGRAQTV
ncbi:hypothetical protein C8R46DRAFT_1140427 [Mycena filopes]|nr:hypothetical protein C8R46DRAFT_1140427 [Mycena filopes]